MFGTTPGHNSRIRRYEVFLRRYAYCAFTINGTNLIKKSLLTEVDSWIQLNKMVQLGLVRLFFLRASAILKGSVAQR